MLGSAGGPRQALPIVGADTFFIVNGDTLTDVDLARDWRQRTPTSGALVTLALVPNRESAPLRRRALDEPTGASTGFVAARRARPKGRFISSACRSRRRTVFAALAPGAPATTRSAASTTALIAAQPGCDPRRSSATRRSGMSGRRPTTGGRRWRSWSASTPIRLVYGLRYPHRCRRRASRGRFCGTMSRLARTRWSTSAS